MESNTYSELKGQLLILEQIKNPSTWITEAITKLRIEIDRIEGQNRFLSQIENARKEIELIVNKYTDLEIKYTINEKITSPKQIIKIPPIDTGIRVVTHLSALNKDYTFTDPCSFVYRNNEYASFINSEGKRIQISCWKDVLEGVCNIMQQLHPNDINRVLEMRGRKRIYFALSKSQLSSKEAKAVPRKIKNTNIFMETNYPANLHVERSYQVIELFEHERTELNFITLRN